MKKQTGRALLRTLLTMVLCGALLLACVGNVCAATVADVVEKYDDGEVIKIACIGDSVTYGVGGTPYPQQLQTLLNSEGKRYEVKNFGVSGTTAQNEGHDNNVNEGNLFGYRTANPDQGDWNYGDVYRQVIPGSSGKTVYEQSQLYEADIYIIAIGGNDAKVCNWKNGKNDFEADYRALIEEYMALPHDPLVIIGTSPAMVKSSYNINIDAVANTIVPTQRRVAKEMGLPLVETFEPTNDAAYFIDDGVHLNTAGYGVIAKQYAEAIQTLVETPSNIKNLASKYGNEKIKIACIGDSVTQGVGGTPYPQQLQSKLGNKYEVKNFGVSGTSAQNNGHDNSVNDENLFGYRTANPDVGDWNYGDVYRTVIPNSTGKTVYEQSLLYEADIYIIAIGGNDAKACNWNNGDNQFEQDYRALINEYANLPHHPLVIIGTSPAIVKGSYNINVDAVANTIVPTQRQVAEEMGLMLVETFTPTNNAAYFIDDGVHLNTAGYGVVADQYAKAISAMMASLSSAELTSFTAGGAEATIDHETGSIFLSLPYGTDLTKVSATATAGLVSTALTETDFSEPVTLTSVSADGTATKEYTVYASVQRKIRVACVGDSVTAGGFPTQLQAILGDAYDVKNFGVNSTTVQEDGKKETGDGRGAYVYHAAYKQSLTFQPDIVIVLLGSNDSKQGEGKTQGTYNLVTNWKEGSEAAFAAGLEKLVETYRALESAPVVALATSPKAFTTEWGVNPTIVDECIVPIQRQVAEEMDCPLIDVYELIVKRPNLIGGDGLHPNADGNQFIAELYAETIVEQETPVTAPEVTALQVPTLPITAVEYELGAQALNLDGVEFTVIFSDGTTATYPLTTSMVGAFDGNTVGTQTITVSLMGLTTDFEVTVKDPKIAGDVNGDKEVNTTDARLVLQYAVQKIDAAALDVTVADADGDGEVNTTDARLILQLAVDKIDKLPVTAG